MTRRDFIDLYAKKIVNLRTRALFDEFLELFGKFSDDVGEGDRGMFDTWGAESCFRITYAYDKLLLNRASRTWYKQEKVFKEYEIIEFKSLKSPYFILETCPMLPLFSVKPTPKTITREEFIELYSGKIINFTTKESLISFLGVAKVFCAHFGDAVYSLFETYGKEACLRVSAEYGSVYVNFSELSYYKRDQEYARYKFITLPISLPEPMLPLFNKPTLKTSKDIFVETYGSKIVHCKTKALAIEFIAIMEEFCDTTGGIKSAFDNYENDTCFRVTNSTNSSGKILVYFGSRKNYSEGYYSEYKIIEFKTQLGLKTPKPSKFKVGDRVVMLPKMPNRSYWGAPLHVGETVTIAKFNEETPNELYVTDEHGRRWYIEDTMFELAPAKPKLVFSKDAYFDNSRAQYGLECAIRDLMASRSWIDKCEGKTEVEINALGFVIDLTWMKEVK